MERITFIRKEEKKYHDYCYDNYKLFEEGSWLHKPVKAVMDVMSLFEGMENVNILDLGCGVGRNSIPIAEVVKEYGGKVVCVDLLDSALEKLNQYSEEYSVKEWIEMVKADIGDYEIKTKTFDVIVAVSSLEHVKSIDVFDKVINEMIEGTKDKGINCIVINSEMEEIDMKTGEKLDVLMEVNLQTNELMSKLSLSYKGWEVLSCVVNPLAYEIVRNENKVLLKTNAIRYVARKC